ncbi:MAG: FAD-dependent oxidoreductase [Roseateles sp.]|uniref:FAD-dependent oxidoreductase n=1 Tax=Roseateles sp. TaxID=1971397 RepID=UPI0040356B7C
MKRLIAGVALLAAVLLAAHHLGLTDWLTLDALKAQQAALQARVAATPWVAALSFFAVYVLVTAVSLPGAAVLTLAAGALFGFWQGLVLVSFASSLGALLAFLAARYLLRDTLQRRFGQRLAQLNDGVARDGAVYLLSLRLVPLFPFWLVNLLMALTPIRAGVFYGVSQLGMLAGTAVFVNAGTQLATVRTVGDVLTPALLGSFVLLGVFPLLAKALLGWFKRRAVYAGFSRPRRFDRNLIVIGAGAGGLVTSYIAAAVKAEVTLVESHAMGGDCLNFGCVPSKALMRSAKAAQALREAGRFGLQPVDVRVDFAAVMERVQRVVADVAPHDSVERYTGLGVDVVQGHGRLVDPWTVEIASAEGQSRRLTAPHIVIATGARPFVPPIPGLDDVGYRTSDDIWQLREAPQRLLVLGGGPIGCELSQAFARLGVAVTQVEMAPRLMGREDEEVSALVAQSLRRDGVKVLTSHRAVRAEATPEGGKRLWVKHAGGETALTFDVLLVAVGRTARVQGFGLEALGVPLKDGKTIEVNAQLQSTRFPNIYAVGDVAGAFQFTHTASHMAWYAAVNALFGRFKRFAVDYRVVPWVTFTDPEVARVGLSEAEAREQGVAVEVTRYGLDDLDRAIADGAAHGFVKVLTAPGSDKILGATIVGHHAGELIAELVLAMKHGLGLNKLLGTIHAYPTWVEANKQAAGHWKRAHAPARLLALARRLHAWERG